MLHCISTANLPRQPRQLKLLHHGMGAAVIIAISYGKSQASRQDGRRNFFSVLEIPLPHATGPSATSVPRLLHLRSPQPDMCVESVTPFRTIDGDAVYMLVQGQGPAGDVATFLYRRECDTVASNDSSADGSVAGDSAASGGVARYTRLPKTIDTAQRLWTATAAVLTTENAVSMQPRESLARPLVVAASGGSTNALQWVELTGPTRAEVVKTVELPALSTFEVASVLPLPGSGGGRVLLLCHHAVVEVQASLTARKAATVVSNVVITRTWKWTPHDRLTACCLKDHMLCAGTEDGVLVLWDMRQSHGGAVDAANSSSCVAAKSAVTGLCAPRTSSGFVTCALDGSLLSWQHVEDDDAVATLAWQQQQQQAARGGSGVDSSAAMAAASGGEASQRRKLTSGGAAAAAAAAALVTERDMQKRPGFPYVAAPPGVEISLTAPAPKMGVLPGTPGCLLMVGEGNLLAVGRELGQLEVYLCD